MTEELPKNHGFLKFIVIFMGILIVLGLGVVVWKVIDLAKQKAAREKHEAAQQEMTIAPQQLHQGKISSFNFEVALESDEQILETTVAPNGLWFRIGRDGKSYRVILVDMTGKTIGTINIKRANNDADPDN